MTFENDKSLNEIEQMAEKVREDCKFFDLLSETHPQLEKDIEELKASNSEYLAGLEEIAGRMRGEKTEDE